MNSAILGLDAQEEKSAAAKKKAKKTKREIPQDLLVEFSRFFINYSPVTIVVVQETIPRMFLFKTSTVEILEMPPFLAAVWIE